LQQDELSSGRLVIDPVALADVNPQLPHTVVAEFVVAEVVELESVYSPVNSNLRSHVAKPVTSFHEEISPPEGEVMTNFAHRPIVVHKRIIGEQKSEPHSPKQPPFGGCLVH
jgi:hypothetical protein